MYPPKPNLEISTVVGCRMACDYCPQAIHVKNYRGRAGARVMTLELFRACLAKVPTDVEIVFAGMAEPWLAPDATAMVLHAHQKGHQVSVFTTCSGMTLDDLRQIRDIPFRLFCLHVPDADGRMTLKITPEYLEVLGACIREMPQHNFSLIGRIHPEVAHLVDQPLVDWSSGLYSRAGNLEAFKIPRKTGKLRCSACGPKIDHNVLLANGDVALCCMTYDLKHILGNLLVDTYEDLFRSPAYQTVMAGLGGDEALDIACRTCELSEEVK